MIKFILFRLHVRQDETGKLIANPYLMGNSLDRQNLNGFQNNIHFGGVIFLFSLMTVLLQGCSGGGTTAVSAMDRQQRSTTASPVTQTYNNPPIETQNCQYSESGVIYDSSASQLESDAGSTSFRQRLVDFVSISLSPESLGEVSGVYGASTGVQMRLRVRFTSSGQIVSGSSSLEISIYDSYVGQSDESGIPIEPIVIFLDTVKSGTFNASSKQLQVVFADQYGEVSLQGRVQGTDLQGTVSFQNFTSFDNSSPRSGVLGEFLIPACSIGK
jgi:hypothetical protein